MLHIYISHSCPATKSPTFSGTPPPLPDGSISNVSCYRQGVHLSQLEPRFPHGVVLEPRFLFLPSLWSSSRRRYLRQGVCHPGGSSKNLLSRLLLPNSHWGEGYAAKLLCGASISFTVGRARCYSGMTHRVLHIVRRNFWWRLIKIAPSLTPRPSSSSSKTPPLIRVYLRLHPPHGRETPILPFSQCCTN